MKLSLCITTYNRTVMTIESFAKVYDDQRINDIVIIDDCSQEADQKFIYDFCQHNKKIRFFSQPQNVGMSRNKRDAISKALNQWCIIFDSDNILNTDYIDAFYDLVVDGGAFYQFGKIANIEKFIFCPDFAKPEFDYRDFKIGNNGIGMRAGIYAKRECAHEIKNDSFNCLLNTCNYIVHRDNYLATYQYNPDHIASDTIWHNYNHLKAGGLFVVVPDMQYVHRIHKQSGFLQNAPYNMKKSGEVRELISKL